MSPFYGWLFCDCVKWRGSAEAHRPALLPSRCRRYAALECKLGEIDRARGIYTHASHLADPRKDKAFWEDWNAFEVKHGNEDTFREMLRIKRSVAAAFSMTHYNVGGAEEAAAGDKRKREGEAGVGVDSMAALEAAVEAEVAAPVSGTRLSGFVSAGVIQQGKEGDKEGAPAPGTPPLPPPHLSKDK